jgi:tetratricopeptide (TPR) repeat protein
VLAARLYSGWGSIYGELMAMRGGGRVRVIVGALAFAGSAAVSAAPPAAATEAGEPSIAARAQQLYDEGSQAYSLGNFALAIEKFEAAYELTQAVELLYNIGLAYTKRHALAPDVEHLRKARLLFENFAGIREANGEDARDARERAGQLDEQIRQIEAERRAAEQREAEARAAERREAERREAERRAALRATPPPRPRYRPGRLGIAGYTGLGVGLLAGTGLAIVGFDSAALLREQYVEEAGGLSVPAAREAEYARHIGEARTLGFVGVGVGAALAVTGVALIVVDARRGRTGRRVALGPAGVTVTF